jgi:hypothetical protein
MRKSLRLVKKQPEISNQFGCASNLPGADSDFELGVMQPNALRGVGLGAMRDRPR